MSFLQRAFSLAWISEAKLSPLDKYSGNCLKQTLCYLFVMSVTEKAARISPSGNHVCCQNRNLHEPVQSNDIVFLDLATLSTPMAQE